MEQDLFEDYINIHENKQPNQDESKVRSAIIDLEKKKQSENKAIKIVEFLIEGKIRPETFLKSLVYLNSTYYQDVVEERAINKTCGYALCGNKLTWKSKNRYCISTKSNKVYDLSEYSAFCCISCFNASNHIKDQIDDSPLWLREFERISSFHLLPKGTSHLKESVNLKMKQKSEETPAFIPFSAFAELSLDDFDKPGQQGIDENKKFTLSAVMNKDKSLISGPAEKTKKLHTVVEMVEEEGDKGKECEISQTVFEEKLPVTEGEINCAEGKQAMNSKEVNTASNKLNQHNTVADLHKANKNSRNLKIINDKIKSKNKQVAVKVIDPLPMKIQVVEGNCVEKQLQLVEKSLKFPNVSLDRSSIQLKFSLKNSISVENQLRNTFSSWITLDTLIYIHGEDQIKEILDRNRLSDYFEKFQVSKLELTQQQKYVEICRKLKLQELLEEKWDNIHTKNVELQPLPEYSKLKAETKELDIKVKNFYGGSLYEVDDCNFKMTEKEDTEGVPPVLPLADVNSQNALRRRVLLTSLNKSIKFFLDLINYDDILVYSNLQELIKTFKLSADNVVFKPVVCDYVGFICLRILALKDAELTNLLQKQEFQELQKLIFESLPTKQCVLSDSLQLIENLDRFITNYICP